jgi:hypothetical protein
MACINLEETVRGAAAGQTVYKGFLSEPPRADIPKRRAKVSPSQLLQVEILEDLPSSLPSSANKTVNPRGHHPGEGREHFRFVRLAKVTM